jgi:hypothetical protein
MNARFKFLIFTLFSMSAHAAATNPCFPNVQEYFAKAERLMVSNQNLLASQQYNLISTVACRDEDKALALLGSARTFYRLSENQVAEETIQELNHFPKASQAQKKARFLKAWYQPDFRESLNLDEKQNFENFVRAEHEFRKEHQLKKPWLAGTFSAVIPGSGQVYNGNYQSAALSFVLNSLFLATSLELQREGLHTAALASGVIFSITYAGGILGSVESAHQINQSSQQPEIERIRRETLPEVEP